MITHNCSKISLVFFACICFSISAYCQISFKEYYLETMQRAEEYTVAIIRAMPEDKFDFKPTPEVNSFHDQITHVIKNIGFLQTYITGKRDSPIRDLDLNSNNKDQLLEHLDIAFDHLYAIVEHMSEEDFAEITKFFAKDVKMDKRGILLLIKNHMTMHHGQLIFYLRLNGITPPRFNGY